MVTRAKFDLYSKAEELAAQPYDLIITSDELINGQNIWTAKSPELPGATGQGLAPDKAVKDLILARTDFIWFLLLDGLEVPVTNHSKIGVHYVGHIFKKAVHIND